VEADRNQVAAGPWAARLPRAHAAAAAALRGRADVSASIVDDQIWLRGRAMDESLDAALRRVAPQMRYTLAGDDELTPAGNVLPVGRLPNANWVPLARLLEAQRPTTALPAQSVPTVPLRLLRSEQVRPATYLLATISDFARYAGAAPGVRLRPLRFAASNEHVLITGSPLPPVPGLACWESSGVVAPCGWEWSPAVDAATVRRVLRLHPDEVALLRGDDTWHLLRESSFVAARRSAVRATARGASA